MASQSVTADIKLLEDALKKVLKTQNFTKFNRAMLLLELSTAISKLKDYNDRLELSLKNM